MILCILFYHDTFTLSVFILNATKKSSSGISNLTVNHKGAMFYFVTFHTVTVNKSIYMN